MRLASCGICLLLLTSCTGTGNKTIAQMDVVKNMDINRFEDETYQMLVKKAAGRGYDIKKLMKAPQKSTD